MTPFTGSVAQNCEGRVVPENGTLLLLTESQLVTICLNINKLDTLNFIMSLFHASACFEHMCSPSGGQNCTIQSLVSSHL